MASSPGFIRMMSTGGGSSSRSSRSTAHHASGSIGANTSAIGGGGSSASAAIISPVSITSPLSASTIHTTPTPTSQYGAGGGGTSAFLFRHHLLNAIEAVPSPVLGPIGSASTSVESPLMKPAAPRAASGVPAAGGGGGDELPRSTDAANNATSIAASATTGTNSILAPPPTAAALASLEGPLLSEDEDANIYGGYTVQKTLGIGAFSRVVLAMPPPTTTSTPHHRSHASRTRHTGLDALSRAGSSDAPEGIAGFLRTGSASYALQPAFNLPSSAADGPRLVGPRLDDQQAQQFAAVNPSPLPTAETLRLRTASPLQSYDGLPAHTSPFPHPPISAPAPSMRLSLQTKQLQPPRRPPPIALATSSSSGSVVALKMLEREPCRTNQRMKVSWVREVEVLKHISHPSLIRLLRSFCTPTYNILVLEAVSGGELFDLVAQHHADILVPREWLVRRLVGELASAVGWMHSINLVHRDIKLENILLTQNLGGCADLRPSLLPSYFSASPPISEPRPLLKLTDFGLSRFIDPEAPHLETRCGSEEYAAPELIMGRQYDGRRTDAWALGVVVYALLTGSLPFLENLPGSSGASEADVAAATEGRARGGVSAAVREAATGEGGTAVLRDPRARKAHLLRIAKGDLRWPEIRNERAEDAFGMEDDDDLNGNATSDGAQVSTTSASSAGPLRKQRRYRLITPRAQSFVARLLRRDAAKRASAWDAWDEGWLTHGSYAGSNTSRSPSDEGGPPSDQLAYLAVQAVKEASAQGDLFEVPLDPRSTAGQRWVENWTRLRTEPLSAFARDD